MNMTTQFGSSQPNACTYIRRSQFHSFRRANKKVSWKKKSQSNAIIREKEVCGVLLL